MAKWLMLRSKRKLYAVHSETFIKKISDEANVKFLKRRVSFRSKIEIKAVSYQSIFDLATSIDKLVSSSAFTGNEIRLEVGYEISDDPNLNTHHITKTIRN